MKEILALIEKKKQDIAQTQLIQFMQDKSIDPRQRLAWTPAFAPFAMMFKDFNRIVLYKEPADSKIQEMINQHSREDAQHWSWFLKDMQLMGYDSPINYTDALKFLWGEETVKVRQMAYNLFGICTLEEDVLIKLAVAESVEAIGNVGLFEASQVAKELTEITKQHYPYFGPSHIVKETGHIQADMDSVENFIENIQLTEAQKEKAFTLIEKVFADFADSMNEMFTFAHKHAYDRPFTTMSSINKSVLQV